MRSANIKAINVFLYLILTTIALSELLVRALNNGISHHSLLHLAPVPVMPLPLLLVLVWPVAVLPSCDHIVSDSLPGRASNGGPHEG